MFLFDRRYLRSFDWISFFLVITLSLVGLFFVFSATYKPEQPYSVFFQKNLWGIVSGIVIYILFCTADYRSLMRWGYFFYFVTLGLLLFTLIKGSIGGWGGQRWISIGFIKLQISELAKLTFPAFAAYYLYTQDESGNFTFRDFVPILGILGFSFLLILKQPDLGTALILLFSGLILLWLAGINKLFFVGGMVLLLAIAPFAIRVLKPYQQQRIWVYLGYGDIKKERYQIEQSIIAIGSGGLTGKGFLKGTQNRLQFLPANRTDFIFSVIAEEIGFIGACIVILLYLILFLRLLAVVTSIKHLFTQLLAMGLILHIILSTIINIGMTVGLLPIVGIPLPLITYGLSNLWITYASLGWVNGIAMRRFYIGHE